MIRLKIRLIVDGSIPMRSNSNPIFLQIGADTDFRDIIINRNEFVYEIFDGEKILCIVKKKKDWGGKDRFDEGKKERDLVKRGWKSSRNSCRKIYILLPRNHGFLECRGEESFRTLVETTRFPMKEINKTQAAKL